MAEPVDERDISRNFSGTDVEYTIGAEMFEWIYFLTYGIYPDKFKIFIQSVANATDASKK